MRIPKYQKGMTLVELMIVIVIVGVLSLLAVTGYRKYTFQARASEAQNFLGAIRVAQEAYYQSFGEYCGAAAPALWPAAIPGDEKVAWGEPAPLAWQHLGIKSPGFVQFQYELVAGLANEGGGDAFVEQPQRPWFIARAHGDMLRDNENRQSFYEVTSESETIYSHNENY